MAGSQSPPRPTEIPFESLRYQLTPLLVSMLTRVHEWAGVVRGTRLSHYGKKRLEISTRTRRILQMALRSGSTASEDEVRHVLAGDLLTPRRQIAQEQIRRAVMLSDTIDALERRGDVTTADTFTTYLDITSKNAPNWARYTGHQRADVIEALRVPKRAAEPVAKFYAWMDADPLPSCAKSGSSRSGPLTLRGTMRS